MRGVLLSSLMILASACTLKSNKPGAVASDKIEYMRMEDNYEPLQVERTIEPSPYFVKEGRPYCFAGTNNYYLMYKSKRAVVDVLDVAQAMNLGMLRMWAFLDRGSLDGVVPNARNPGHADGVYFQYWDAEAGKPAYNDGPDGLERLDFVLSEARKRGISLTLALTNNWREFGGMDQYLIWYGLNKHHEFYTDARVKQAYKDWLYHVINRVNSIDGIAYKNDPAIFAWELTNEARTINYESFDSPDGWTTDTIANWADEMSAYVKSLDPNHMVAVGDEGFLNGGRPDWTYEAPFGVDNEKLAALPNIDFGTYHMYPDHWGKGHRWGNDWIEDHNAASRRVGKPMVLEEYGIHIKRKNEVSGPIVHGWERRKVAYINWNNLILHRGGQVSMFWILAGIEDSGELYPDYDHFTVYNNDETFDLLKGYADRMNTDATACVLAKDADHGPSSPFISWRPAPKAGHKAAPLVEPTKAAPKAPVPASEDGSADIYRVPHAFSNRVPS